jgi:hypothetical protein
VSGAGLAENTLSQLGAEEDDEVMKELDRLRGTLGTLKKELEKADGRLGKLDYVRKMLLHGTEGKKLIEEVRKPLKVFLKTLNWIDKNSERARKVKNILDNLEDERYALDALGEYLSLMSEAGGKVPVIGKAVSSFLKAYARAAKASGEAARGIQDYIIKGNIENLFDNPKPERKLYTVKEVKVETSLENADANRRIAEMLQVRRLMFLIQATRIEHARELR